MPITKKQIEEEGKIRGSFPAAISSPKPHKNINEATNPEIVADSSDSAAKTKNDPKSPGVYVRSSSKRKELDEPEEGTSDVEEIVQEINVRCKSEEPEMSSTTSLSVDEMNQNTGVNVGAVSSHETSAVEDMPHSTSTPLPKEAAKSKTGQKEKSKVKNQSDLDCIPSKNSDDQLSTLLKEGKCIDPVNWMVKDITNFLSASGFLKEDSGVSHVFWFSSNSRVPDPSTNPGHQNHIATVGHGSDPRLANNFKIPDYSSNTKISDYSSNAKIPDYNSAKVPDYSSSAKIPDYSSSPKVSDFSSTSTWGSSNDSFKKVDWTGTSSGDRGDRGRGGSRGGGGRGGGSAPREGDWTCPDSGCGNSNFSWRKECFKCNTTKPGDSGGGGSFAGGNRRGGGGGGSGPREGDWTCPDSGCGNSNFSWRKECFKCQTSKPDSGNDGGMGRGGGSFGSSYGKENGNSWGRDSGGSTDWGKGGGDRGSRGGRGRGDRGYDGNSSRGGGGGDRGYDGNSSRGGGGGRGYDGNSSRGGGSSGGGWNSNNDSYSTKQGRKPDWDTGSDVPSKRARGSDWSSSADSGSHKVAQEEAWE